MSGDVDEADRLARVTLSRAIEPGDLRVTGLVSELGASKVLGYLEAAAEVESHWGFGIAQELGRVDPAQVLEQAAARGIRFIVPGDAEWPTQLGALRAAGALHDRGVNPSACGSSDHTTCATSPATPSRSSAHEPPPATAPNRPPSLVATSRRWATPSSVASRMASTRPHTAAPSSPTA